MQTALYNRLYFIVAPILLGLITVFSQPPYFILPFLFIAYGGLYNFITQEKRFTPAIKTIILFWTAYYIANFHWFYPFAKVFLANSSIEHVSPLALGFTFLSIFPSFLISTVALVCFWLVLKRYSHPVLKITIFATLITVSEALRGLPYAHGSPWGLSIYSITDNLSLSQIAAVPKGIWYGTIILIGISAGIFCGKPKYIFFSVCAFALWLFIGVMSATQESPTTDTLHARVVQVNAPPFQGTAIGRLKQYMNVSNDPGLNSRDVVLWPENSTPVLNSPEDPVLKTIQQHIPNPVIGGASIMMPSHPDEPLAFYNTIGHLNAYPYQSFISKTIRVPFGEYAPLPFTDVRFLPLLNIQTTPLSAKNLTIGSTAIAPINCYEVLHSGFVKNQARKADIIYVSSNDNVMSEITPRTAAAMPYIARLRAIENRKPLIRNANDGFVTYIGPNGRFLLNDRAEFPTAYDIDISYTSKLPQ